MSTQQFTCVHCGRTNFKSKRGLNQHLATSRTCKEKEDRLLTTNVNSQRLQEEARAREFLTNEGRRATRGQVQAYLAEESQMNYHHDEDPARLLVEQDARQIDQPDPIQPVAGNEEQNDGSDFPMQDVDDDNSDIENEGAEVNETDSQASKEEPSSRGRDEFVKFCNDNTFFAPLTDAETTGIYLMEVLRKKKAPMNAYPSLMDWHLRENGVISGRQRLRDAGPTNYIGRQTLINRLAKRYNLHNKKPIEKTVRLPSSKEIVRIPVFDAEDCIVQLLTDPRLEPKDFDFFDDDPLAPPPEDPEFVGNVITGSSFRNTYKDLITEDNQQLLGAIYYIDGAATGLFSDLPVTAVKFSLTCFTREARLRDHMWAVLGYLPQVKIAEGRGKKLFQESQHLEAEDLEIFDGEGDEIDFDGDASDKSEDGLTEVKAQDFHVMLSVILESYVKLQGSGMFWDLMYKGKQYKRLHFSMFVPFVRCDTEEADTLCGKYKTRTRNIKHICRQCHIPTMEASNFRANPRPKTQKQIEKLIKQQNLQGLQAISQHYLKNAWYKVRFGSERGIHWACPSEMLHMMQLGIFKYIRDIFFDFIGETAHIAHEINGLARIYGKLLSHQSDRSLPATNFAKGIKDGKLMAKDYRGVLLIMGAIIRSSSGRKMLGTKRKFKQTHQKDDWLLVVETLLEWEAYLCQPEMQLKHVKRLDKKHRYIMYLITKVAKRTQGMGLNFMKFHAILHLMESILADGVPLEVDTAANESHHKSTKHAAHLTQRNEANFQIQVATRMWEFKVLDLALEELETGRRVSDYYVAESSSGSGSEMSTSSSNSDPSENSDVSGTEILTDDAQISVFFDEELQANTFVMLSKSKYKEKTTLNIELLNFLVDLQNKVLAYLPTNGKLPIFTRHTRAGVVFRGHPNFRGNGPWKDWVIINWGPGWGQLPSHISCFIMLEGIPAGNAQLEHGGIRLKNGVFAVVESSELVNEEDELGRSDLFIPFVKQTQPIVNEEVTGRVFYLADTEAFVKPCAVIPDIGGPPNRYFLVRSRNDWSGLFAQWVESPHNDDAMSDEEAD